MNKNQMRDLMTYVCDQNANSLIETLGKLSVELSEEQLRVLTLALESSTKECFFRMMDKL